MATCKNCGTELVEGAKFCKNCGSRIIQEDEKVEASQLKLCPGCGNEVKDGMKFCQNCGARINHDENNQKRFCNNCGFEMDDNLKFCPECGTSTSNATQGINSTGVTNPGKSAGLAAVLSFLIIGLGQVYLGLTKKGIILFVLAIVSGVLMAILIGFVLWLLVWGYAIYDAYNSAGKINSGIPVEDTLDFNNLF